MALPIALTGILNDTIVVKSQAMDGYGLTSSQAVTWSSSDNTNAPVQPLVGVTGGAVIHCIGVGNFTITATSGSITQDIKLAVVNPTASTTDSINVTIIQADQQPKP